MNTERFYDGNVILHGELPEIKLEKTVSGGLDVYVDDHKIPGVLGFSIRRDYPFPCVNLRIGMSALTLPPGHRLDDCNRG